MDRIEKKPIWTSLILSRPLRQAQRRLCGTDPFSLEDKLARELQNTRVVRAGYG
jgi:hypothetical protein